MKQDRYWLANGKQYKNLWRAYDELSGTKHNPELYLYNSFFKNLKGLKIDPKHDYIKITLEKIFRDYGNVNLLYSGGTDSHSIYMYSKQHQLKFNKIVTIGWSLDSKHPNEGLYYNDKIKSLMADENYLYQQNNLQMLEHIFCNTEWWYNDPSTELMLDTKLSSCPFWNNDVWLTGHDKPHLFQHNGRWYCMILHQSILDSLHLDNVIWFWGLNNICPELLISQSRLARDFLVNNGTGIETKFYGYKNLDINNFNKSIGRHSINPMHDTTQSMICSTLTAKNSFLTDQLFQAKRDDIWNKFVKDCQMLYKKHKQIEWEYPMFEMTGKVAWLLDIDSLEYIPGSQFDSLLNSK